MVTNEEIKLLIAGAIEGQSHSYSPYSNFSVGAAVLGTDGKIYTGGNIENASYGMTVCAERVAIFKMISCGCTTFKALAVTAGEEPGESGPCAACRQVIAEFCEDINTTEIISAGHSGNYRIDTVIELYPRPFTKFDPNH